MYFADIGICTSSISGPTFKGKKYISDMYVHIVDMSDIVVEEFFDLKQKLTQDNLAMLSKLKKWFFFFVMNGEGVPVLGFKILSLIFKIISLIWQWRFGILLIRSCTACNDNRHWHLFVLCRLQFSDNIFNQAVTAGFLAPGSDQKLQRLLVITLDWLTLHWITLHCLTLLVITLDNWLAVATSQKIASIGGTVFTFLWSYWF